jgi:alpha-ketoglutarate-dependent taurine dioxygenase
LTITWQDGAKSKFPNIWLRGSVRDPKYFDVNCLFYNQDPYIGFINRESPIVRVESDKGREDILVEWEDHTSSFNASWLRAQDFGNNKELCKKPDITLWNTDLTLPTYQYSEKAEKFETWFGDMRRYGLAVFQGVPPDEEGLMGILRSIGQEAQRTHPTNVLSIAPDEKKEGNYDNQVYTTEPHPLHVDTAYYGTPMRLSCLLCSYYTAPVADTYNYFVDNLKVIEELRREEPAAYKLLSTVPLRLARRRLTVPEECDPADYYLYHYDNVEKKPVISFDEREKHNMLYLSNKQAGIDLSSADDPSTMKKYYEAYELLQTKLDDPANHQRLIMKQGTAVIFNNGRVSHGRDVIHDSTVRGMLLAFCSEAMWNSRWRILNGKKSLLDDKWLYGCSAQELELLADRQEG